MRRLVAVAALAGAVASGCSASHHTSPPATQPATQPARVPAAAGAAGATAWWTASDYCGMLRQTVKAGHSILPGVSAGDPNYAKVTTTFVTQLEHAAPSQVAAAWGVLGGVIVALVHPGASTDHVDPAKIKSAVATVSADAKTRCGLDLSVAAH